MGSDGILNDQYLLDTTKIGRNFGKIFPIKKEE
jgi:hypothetical protein